MTQKEPQDRGATPPSLHVLPAGDKTLVLSPVTQDWWEITGGRGVSPGLQPQGRVFSCGDPERGFEGQVRSHCHHPNY